MMSCRLPRFHCIFLLVFRKLQLLGGRDRVIVPVVVVLRKNGV